MPSNLPFDVPDSGARERALDVSRSFLVQAPAGSGKTELLIGRFLALLDTVDNPEEIIAITFTVKAAGEMRRRVLAALADDPARDRWQLREYPVRLRIQTIDALCASLMRQMPLLSRFGAAPAAVEDASAHYLEAARRTIALVDSDDAAAEWVARVLAHLDNNVARLEELLVAMLARRDQWLRRTGNVPSRAEMEGVLAGERALRIAGVREAYGGDVDDWPALADSLLTRKGEWRKSLQGAHDGNEPLRRALLAIRGMPPAAYSETQWEALSAIAALLPRAAAQLKLVFEARGAVDFTEIAEAALRALGGDTAPTDLALALDYRIRHLLVDEFQDTSISQYELIARLTAGWEAGDGRSFFAVGDPMQSIYRFREAEVGEFLKSWRTGRVGSVAVERVRLSANFRSQAHIVEWVNRAFARILPAHENIGTGAVPYTASVPVRGPQAGAGVNVLPFALGDRRAEARRVIELIRLLREQDADGRIAILVRDRGALREIVPCLREAGMRFRAIDIDPLGERAVVQDLWALTRAILHPADRIAWLAILRAPWCGLRLADLGALSGTSEPRPEQVPRADVTLWEALNDNALLQHVSADGRARLARVRDVLQPTFANRLRLALRDTVERAWHALGGPACLADDTGLEDAAIYFDALERAEEAGALPDISGFARSLEKLWARPDVHAGERDVQVMTIHKAKGLEFDHVIVPGLGRPVRADEKRLILWLERPIASGAGGAELLLAPIEEAGAESSPVNRWMREQEAERLAHETARLLYVASTRAKTTLHLLGEVDAARARPAARSLLETLWPAVEDAAASLVQPAAPAGTAAQVLPDQKLIRLADNWRTPPPPPGPAWSGAAESRDNDTIEYSWAGETARHVGGVVHRWLQRIAEDQLQGWDAKRVGRLRSGVHAQLMALGVARGDLAQSGEDVLSALCRAITDQRGRWLLGPRRAAKTEYRIRVHADGVARTYVIDRLFCDDEGRRWIVDFKTSRHEGGAVDAFLDREQARYRAQLDAYARALGGEFRLGLYFPLFAGWREW